MTTRTENVAQAIVRKRDSGGVRILAFEHGKWRDPQGRAYWTLPCKKTRNGESSRLRQGVSVDEFVKAMAQEDLGLQDRDYWLDQEMQPTTVVMDSPTHNVPTDYTLYPISLCVSGITGRGTDSHGLSSRIATGKTSTFIRLVSLNSTGSCLASWRSIGGPIMRQARRRGNIEFSAPATGPKSARFSGTLFVGWRQVMESYSKLVPAHSSASAD